MSKYGAKLKFGVRSALKRSVTEHRLRSKCPFYARANVFCQLLSDTHKKMFQDNLKKNTQQFANGQNKGNVTMSNEFPDTMTGLGHL